MIQIIIIVIFVKLNLILLNIVDAKLPLHLHALGFKIISIIINTIVIKIQLNLMDDILINFDKYDYFKNHLMQNTNFLDFDLKIQFHS